MSHPELKDGVLQRALLTKRFALQGYCPGCSDRLILRDTEIDRSQDTCPSCHVVFSIPDRFPSRKQAILQKERDTVEAKEKEKDLRRQTREQERASRLEKERLEAERVVAAEQAQAAARTEQERLRLSFEFRAASMKVTTGDLHEPYEIIGPVYFSVSNKGIFFNALGELIQHYNKKLQVMRDNKQLARISMDWSFLYGQQSVGQSQFDSAFFVAVEELKLRAARIGADAVVHMRQDIDIDTNGMQYFYLQMYGTAVRLKANA